MNRIGLLSDAHGRGPITRQAVELLLGHGAEVLLYLGDVCGEAVVDALAVESPVQSRLVFGNCDFDQGSMTRYAESLGIAVDHPAGEIATPRGPLVYCHGHEPGPMRQAMTRGAAYLCHGHTHLKRDERIGETRVINPGALFRASEHTVAILDIASDELAFYPVAATC